MRYTVASLLLLALLAGLAGFVLFWGRAINAPVSPAPQPPEASGQGERNGRVPVDRATESPPIRTRVNPPPSENVKRTQKDDQVDPQPDTSDEVAALKEDLQKSRDRTRALRIEVRKLRNRYKQLEARLVWENFEGAVGRWLAMVPEKERPSEKEVKKMVRYLDGFTIQELRYEEGKWLLERFEKDDWKTWGNTSEEAILIYFGVRRATEGLPPEEIARLRIAYPHHFR